MITGACEGEPGPIVLGDGEPIVLGDGGAPIVAADSAADSDSEFPIIAADSESEFPIIAADLSFFPIIDSDC